MRIKNTFKKLGWVAAIAFAVYSLSYIAFSNRIFGYRVCLSEKSIISDVDVVQKLRIFVQEEAEKLRVAYKDFTLQSDVVDQVLDKYAECVAAKGLPACEKETVIIRVADEEIGFYYEPIIPTGGYSFSMNTFGTNGYSRYGFHHWGVTGMWEIGCGQSMIFGNLTRD